MKATGGLPAARQFVLSQPNALGAINLMDRFLSRQTKPTPLPSSIIILSKCRSLMSKSRPPRQPASAVYDVKWVS